MPIKKSRPALFAAAQFAGALWLGAVLAAGFAAPALADSADGTIQKIDAGDNSLTLSNGKIYKLPGEFDYSGFHAGQKVTVFFDTDPSGSYISDIELQGAKAADTETPAANDGDGLPDEKGNPNADSDSGE